MKEEWRDIPGYEGIYQASNLGNIRSNYTKLQGHPTRSKGGILKATSNNNGYLSVALYKDGKKKKYLIHRLIATTFIPNPNNLPQINHKDENRHNNHADNLEWCTARYNNWYGTARIRSAITAGKPVQQFTLSGFLIAEYKSSAIAAELLGLTKNGIGSACRSGKAAYGYLWKFSDDSAFSRHSQRSSGSRCAPHRSQVL